MDIAILGAGPAGLGAAYKLTKRQVAGVTVVEKATAVGGLSSSFPISGIFADFGSHRLHSECRPDILADLQLMLGDDLLLRKRRGRIRLQGRWLDFPLRPLNMIKKMPKHMAFGLLFHLLFSKFRKKPTENSSFADVMMRGVGPGLCRDFYFPYARKIWGLEPEEISSIQALRRVSARSVGALLRRVLSSLGILGKSKAAYFYYPRKGYGQISEKLSVAAEESGATVLLGTEIKKIIRNEPSGFKLLLSSGKGTYEINADQIWSTIPLNNLIKLLDLPVPQDVHQSLNLLESRAMILVYLAFNKEKVTHFDTHYFPEEQYSFTRVSEPKNFSGFGPIDKTILCAELPTQVNSKIWNMSDMEIGQSVIASLVIAGVLKGSEIPETQIKRLPNAYPIYKKGFEDAFDLVDHWVGSIEGLVTFGRQGLFAHNNLHHVLEMAYGAVDSLQENGMFDKENWRNHRVSFDKQVVVD